MKKSVNIDLIVEKIPIKEKTDKEKFMEIEEKMNLLFEANLKGQKITSDMVSTSNLSEKVKEELNTKITEASKQSGKETSL